MLNSMRLSVLLTIKVRTSNFRAHFLEFSRLFIARFKMATRKWNFFVSLFEILRPKNGIELNCYHRSEQWHRYSLLKTFNLSLKRILRCEIRVFLLSLLCRCKIVNFNKLQAVNASFLVELIKFHHLKRARQVEISSERDIHGYFVTFWKSFQWLSIKDTTTHKQQQLTVEWRHEYV